MPKIVEDVQIQSNIDEFNQETDKLNDNWEKTVRFLSAAATSGKRGATAFSALIKNLGEIKEPIDDFKDLGGAADYVSDVAFNKMRAAIKDINEQVRDLVKGGTLDTKAASKLNTLIRRRVKLFENTKDIAEKGVKQSKIHSKVEEQVADEVEKTWQFKQKQLRQEMRLNREVARRIKRELKGRERIIALAKLNVKYAKLYVQQSKLAAKALAGTKKVAEGLKNTMATAFAPLIALFSIGAILSKLGDADKRLRQITATMYDLNSASGQFGKGMLGVAKGQAAVFDQLRKKLHLSGEEIADLNKSLVDAGFTVDQLTQRMTSMRKGTKESFYAFEDFMGVTRRFGMDLGSMASQFGTIYENLGDSFGSLVDSFTLLAEKGKDSGMVMSRFLSRVTNAASGMGLFGTKVIDVGNFIANLHKQMKLPERESEEMAQKMIKAFTEMDTSMQYLIVDNSRYMKDLNSIFADLRKGDASVDDLVKRFAEVQGVTEQLADPEAFAKLRARFLSLSKFTDTLDRATRSLVEADPGRQFEEMMRFAFGRVLGIDTDNPTMNAMQDALKKMQSTTSMHLEAFQQYMGLDTKQARALQDRMIEYLQGNIDAVQKGTQEEGKSLLSFFEQFRKGVESDNLDQMKEEQRQADRAVRKEAKTWADQFSEMLDDLASRWWPTIRNWLQNMFDELKTFWENMRPVFEKLGRVLDKLGGYFGLETETEKKRQAAQDVVSRKGRDVSSAIRDFVLKRQQSMNFPSAEMSKLLNQSRANLIEAVEQSGFSEDIVEGMVEKRVKQIEDNRNINLTIYGGNVTKIRNMVLDILYEHERKAE